MNSEKEIVESVEKLLVQVTENLELVDLLEVEDDVESKQELEQESAIIKHKVEEMSLFLLLDGPYDKNDCILEIHPGAGGTESCDWALMLYRMYTRWCEKKKYKIEILDYQDGEEAGIKSVSIRVKGPNAYGYLKNEKGVHRLVRLSPFDSNNRRHTSFASIEVTPEIEQDNAIEIDEKDLKIDVYRSTGAGGQGVNTTDSAVRLTHIPTGIIVYSQTERSQIKNKEKAIKILKTRLYDLKLREKEEKEGAERRSKIGTGDRSEKIRTYNYPQNRLTDHRINFTIMQLDRVMMGKLGDVIDALIAEDQKRKLEKDVI